MGASVDPVFGVRSVDVVIASGAQLSGPGELNERRLVGLIIPADTEGTAVTFEGSVDGVNFFDVYDADGVYSVDFTDPCYLAVDPLVFVGLPYVKVDTGTNQTTAAATITLVAA